MSQRPCTTTAVALVTALALVALAPGAVAEGEENDPCVRNARAEPLTGGTVHLTWDARPDADGIAVWKNVRIGAPPAEQEFVVIATLPATATEFTDLSHPENAPFEYVVQDARAADTACPLIEGTSIPYASSPLVLLATALVSAAAIALAGRWRRGRGG